MVLIIGCGFLGQYILEELQGWTDEAIVATYRDNKNDILLNSKNIKWIHFDVTKEPDITKLKQICSDEALTVFYLASCHNVDFVFNHPQFAYQVNVSALKVFLKEFTNIKKFFYASTDCVYGEGIGRNRGFKETDVTMPINIYGKQKREAEQLVLQAGFHIVRLPYMLGPSLSKKKNFYDTVVDELNHLCSVYMVDGFERSVLSYRQVAKILVSLSLKKNIPSILNIASDNSYTKYMMGCRIAEHLGCSEVNIKKLSDQTAKSFFVDNRAESTVMNNQLLKKVLKINQLEWECP